MLGLLRKMPAYSATPAVACTAYAGAHYRQYFLSNGFAEHVDKPFFRGLVEFITSAPVVAMVWQADNAIEAVRKTMGETSPAASGPGTIRGDLALDIGRNLVHGSDSPESAERELDLFFSAAELLDYTRANDGWIKE